MQRCFPACVRSSAVRLALLACAASLAAAAAAPTYAARHARSAQAPSPNAGIVDIYTTLGYETGRAAGTGMIVSPNGEVLTNNHVIRGATAFRVVDVTTHRSYSASVVGYTVAGDVAVLKLAGATHLQTVPLGRSTRLVVGRPVVARGNAGGAGGAPKVASGRITGLHRRIVASDGQDSETLTNLIETDAPVEPGDSGGPLFNARGRVIGMVTAGSTSFRFRGGGVGYAIPITKARALARQILLGHASLYLHIGATAFLGVGVQDAPGGGAAVTRVVPGSAAEIAGIVAGDVITGLNGAPIRTATDLQHAVLALTPGRAVALEWTDGTGITQTGTVTPASGPPQ